MGLYNTSLNRVNSDLDLYPILRSKRALQINRKCTTKDFYRIPVDHIPNFQFPLQSSTTFEIRVLNYNTGATVATYANATLQNYIYTEESTGNEYLIISDSFITDNVTLAKGTYEIEVDVDGTTYYGESFIVQDAIGDLDGCHYFLMSWSHTCFHRAGIYYSDKEVELSINKIYIPYFDETLDMEFSIEKEGHKNGEGRFFSTLTIMDGRYKLYLPATKFSIAALNFIELCDNVVLQDNRDFADYNLSNVEVEVSTDFRKNCWQLADLTFQIGENRGQSLFNERACCDDEILADTVLEDIVNNECETFVREGCDFEVVITSSTSAGTGGTGTGISLTANVYDRGTTDPYSGTVSYTWKRVNNGACDCETLVDDQDIVDGDTVIVRDDGRVPPIDNKGKYICIVENASGCRMSNQYNYQANCKDGSTRYEPDNPDCVDFGVSLSFDNTNKEITATPENVPVGETTTFIWWYTEPGGQAVKLSDTASTIAVGTNFGAYEVEATAGDCEANDTLVYSDDCENFKDFTKEVDGDSITYTSPSGFSSITYAWVYIDENGTRTPLATTSPTHIAQNTGYYEMTAQDGNCQYVNTTYMRIDDCTGKSVSITKSGNTLTAVPTGFSGSETYDWFKDTGPGESSLSNTNPEIEANESANFIVKVTEGACTVEGNKVVILETDSCDITATINQSGANLEVVVTGCNDDLEIDWYLYDESTDNFNWVNDGLTHTPSSYGTYKARIKCGDCPVVTRFKDFND